jgi:hypothetical protein
MIEVIQFNQHRYRCRDCGYEFKAKDKNCPGKGRFGVGVLTYLTMLKFGLRGVLRRIRDFTAHINAFKISPKGIQDAIIGCRGRGDAIPLFDKDPPASRIERKEQKIAWVNYGRTHHREHVLIEKIIGTFRSTKGAEYYQYIASRFAKEWQKKDIFEELDGLLRKEQCVGEVNKYR